MAANPPKEYPAIHHVTIEDLGGGTVRLTRKATPSAPSTAEYAIYSEPSRAYFRELVERFGLGRWAAVTRAEALDPKRPSPARRLPTVSTVVVNPDEGAALLQLDLWS